MKNRTQTTKFETSPLTYEALAVMTYEERQAILHALRQDIESRLQSTDSSSTTYFTKN